MKKHRDMNGCCCDEESIRRTGKGSHSPITESNKNKLTFDCSISLHKNSQQTVIIPFHSDKRVCLSVLLCVCVCLRIYLYSLLCVSECVFVCMWV